MINLKELGIWVVSSILIGLLLSTKFKWPILSIEPTNFLLMVGFSLVMLFIFIVGQKLAASFYDCSIKLRLLSFRQYWFTDQYRLRWPFPLWLILPILLFLVSLGKIIWLAILNFDIEVKSSRIKRRFYNLDDIDVAKVFAAGPVASLIFGLFLKIIGLSNLAVYPILLAFLSVIPVGGGTKILMGSRNLCIFLIVLTGLMLLLITVAGWLAMLILSILIALAVVITYYVMFEQ